MCLIYTLNLAIMKRMILAAGTLLLCQFAVAQLLSWSPQFPTESSTLVVTIDCSKGNRGLFNAADPTNIYVHTGVTTNLSNNGGQEWKYVNGTIGGAWGSATAGLKAISLGNNKYQYTITNIRAFYGVPAGETIKNVSILFRDVNSDGSLVKKQANSDGSDMYIPIYPAGTNVIKFTRPYTEPRFVPFVEPIAVAIGQSVNAKAVASTPVGTGNLFMYFNGAFLGATSLADSLVENAIISAPGSQELVAKLTVGANNYYDTLKFFVSPITVRKPLPTGVVEGINYYNCSDSITLVLFAPKKKNCMLIGDFPGSDWLPKTAYQMFQSPDSAYFWITVKGLTTGTEYAFNYVVDNTIYIADPHCEKILDPFNDQFIPSSTYPSLRAYPTNPNVSSGKNGYVSVLQICGPQYNWRVNSFTPPDSKNLIIYELLVRDFNTAHNYQTIIDSISYFKKLGINAIEFMPLQEFSGNESWGYNPTFYFAPDKAYGTKNKLKELVDTLHSNGIAAILDVVYNQLDAFSAPQGKLYWDAVNGRPDSSNPWLNPIPKHPFNVFQDFNHESTATQYLVNTSLEHWIKEYKMDGFRFDLSKGFTQTFSSDAGTWSNYDPSRVANLNRYYDYIKPRYPNTYMILEHLGVPQEENILIAKGFLPWRKMTDEYNENTLGQTGNKNIGDIMWNYTANGRNAPSSGLVGYMESHDEERIMYKNLNFGAASGSYNIKDTTTALRQTEAAGAVFFTIPGPKMLWQFGERGYDVSINTCSNGTIDPTGNCRLAPKQPLWNYMNNANRRKLFDAWSRMIKLRLDNPNVFNNVPTNFEPNSNNGYVKLLQIGDANIANKQILIVANFAPGTQTKTVTFQKAGDWYNYISSNNNGTGSSVAGLNGLTNSTFNLAAVAQSIVLAPGEYHIYVSGTPCATPAPSATSPITYCQNAAATPLVATGTGLLWYTAATGGTGSTSAPTPLTTAVGTVVFYVSQTIACEGPRLPITVNVLASTPAPTVTSPVNYCKDAGAAALSATGVNLKWYTVATGGTFSATAPTPSTTTVGSITYYVSQTLASCGEGPRAAIVVNVNAVPLAPSVTASFTYCQNAPAAVLTATGNNLLWYTTATGGTGSATAPTPSTAIIGNTNYYVSQTTNGCESPRASITVSVVAVPSAPVVSSPATFCQNTTATPLTATGASLLWYTVAIGGTGSSTAPTPPTTTVGTTTYYVSQTTVCESPRAAIVVNIVATTPAPTVTTPVNYCQNAVSTALSAIGTSLKWYTTATGGTGVATSPTPPTTTVGSTTYYVSQTLSCGEGPRAAIVVSVNAIPAAPTVASPITYCQNTTAASLSSTGNNLLWYTAPTGGTGAATAPIPSTATPGSTTYYVSQTTTGCESPRASIVVNVTVTPSTPNVVANTISYCQNATATPLMATGANLLWYSVATGGTGTASAPTPSTITAGTSNFYVTQTVNSCESPRVNIAVTVTALPAAPTASPVTFCQNAPSVALSATVSGNSSDTLKWYTVATDGISSLTAPIPSTATPGVTNYYVSQKSSACGESAIRTLIAVTVTPTPAIATGLAATNITTTTATINWNQLTGVFYTVEYRPVAASAWISAAAGGTGGSINLTGLSISTQYEWRVNANCANTIAVDYATSQFTTSSRNINISSIKNGIGIKLSPVPVTNSANVILDYLVPGSGEVAILIYSSTGQRVRSLSDGNRTAGQYQFNLTQQIGTLIHGTYIIRVLQNGKGNSSRFVK